VSAVEGSTQQAAASGGTRLCKEEQTRCQPETAPAGVHHLLADLGSWCICCVGHCPQRVNVGGVGINQLQPWLWTGCVAYATSPDNKHPGY
jgi:hypothetical protein